VIYIGFVALVQQDMKKLIGTPRLLTWFS